MRDLIGQTVDGKYRIEKELGKGGMGAVYFAVHLGTKRPVAVKVIVSQFMQRADFIQRFRREAEAAGRLRHPNVVNVTDFGFAETPNGRVAYLVMEYLDGCTLGEILEEEKKLPLAWTIDILEQVCAAVQEAHDQGIIHRDLKPDNIWLEPNPRGGYTAKVLDFGIAKLEPRNEKFNPNEIKPAAVLENTTKSYPQADDKDSTEIMPPETEKNKTGFETLLDMKAIPEPSASLTASENPLAKLPSQIETLIDEKAAQTEPVKIEMNKKNDFHEKTTAEITRVGAIMGTPLYMSPEQCRGERLGRSSDVYSLGVIAYQMLSGKTPFDGEDISIITGHLQFPPPTFFARKVPRKVKKVIYEALSKEPIKRPPTAEIFAAQLRSYSENVIRIFRRASGIFIENFSKLIWFSLLMYLPTILFGLMTFVFGLLKFSDVVPPVITTVTQFLLKTANLASTTIAETLITGAVAWIVIRYIDTPLQSFRVVDAFRALLENWKDFAWILPIRKNINFVIQGYLNGFTLTLVLVLSYLDTLIFWSVPCVIVLERFGGFEIFKRSWRLNLRVFPTILAAAFLNLLIYTIIGVAVSVVFFNLAAYISLNFFPSVYELPYEEFAKLTEGLSLIFIKIAGAVILPFFAVVTALIYLKSRHAGGESLKSLLDEFKKSAVQKRNWQKRIRHRSDQSQQIVSRYITGS